VMILRHYRHHLLQGQHYRRCAAAAFAADRYDNVRTFSDAAEGHENKARAIRVGVNLAVGFSALAVAGLVVCACVGC